jgi:hypothetical protein
LQAGVGLSEGCRNITASLACAPVLFAEGEGVGAVAHSRWVLRPLFSSLWS